MRKSLVAKGVVVLIAGLVLMALMAPTHEVNVQNLSIEKKDGYFEISNFLMAGQEFTAEFVCHQPTSRVRAVLIAESSYVNWRSGKDVPIEQLLGDTSGAFGKITWRVQADGLYYLVLVPVADTTNWPVGVSVKLESKGGSEAGRLAGAALFLIGLVVVIAGFVKKA